MNDNSISDEDTLVWFNDEPTPVYAIRMLAEGYALVNQLCESGLSDEAIADRLVMEFNEGTMPLEVVESFLSSRGFEIVR